MLLRKSQSHCTSDLTAAEASSTGVYVTGRTVNNSLNSLYIGLPSSVGASVGVAHLDTEGNAFFAKFALSHTSHLLACGFAVIFKKSLYKERYLIYHCF